MNHLFFRISLVIGSLLFASLTQARAQATPPTGKPVQYATPFGVLNWMNADYADDGIGRWQRSNDYQLNATLTPNGAGLLDDLGNPYYALLAFHNTANSQNNAQYFAYENGTDETLTLRVKPGSAGSSPFSEIASAVLRDVLNVEPSSTIYVDDGSGTGGGHVTWYFASGRTVADNSSGVDSYGHLYFGAEMEPLQWGLYNLRRAYLGADGIFTFGAPLVGWVGGDAYPHSLPSGMANTYVSANGVSLVWSAEIDGWTVSWTDAYVLGGSYTIYVHMTDANSGDLVISGWNMYGEGEVNFLSVTRNSSGNLVVNGSGGSGAFGEGAILRPSANATALVSPVTTFQFDGEMYTIVSSSPEGLDKVDTIYQSDNGSSAHIVWNAATKTVERVHVNNSSFNVSYTSNGAGGYLFDTSSTGPNALTQINGVNYTPSGDVSAPSEVTQFSGDLDIRGNLLSLGSWNGDWTQPGLNLTYQDGDSVINPALAIWTASRPHTEWLWERVSAGTPNTKPMMKLGSDNVLTIYKTDGTTGITINPNTGRIRIAPQGDLSMGSFNHEPTSP